jgi:S1-C subfamily serine protease
VVELPHEFDRLADLVNSDKSLVSRLGIVGLEIDPKIAAMLPTLRLKGGVIVVARAADANVDTPLTAGDVIHTMNGAPVDNIETFRAALDQMKPNSPVVLQIERQGKLMFVSFQLD